MKLFLIILSIFFCENLFSQSYVYKTIRFKGGNGDGSERSWHNFSVDKVKYPSVMCEGDSAVLSVNYQGTYILEYEWKKVGSNLILGDTALLIIPRTAISDRGLYYCRFTDVLSGRVFYSDTLDLKIKKRPSARIGGSSDSYFICYGDTLKLNALESEHDKEAGDVYVYSWEGGNIIGAYNSNVIQAMPDSSGRYTVTVNNDGCQAEATITAEVYKPEVNIPSAIYVVENQSLEIKPDVPATARLDWQIGEIMIPDMNPLVYSGVVRTSEIEVTMTDKGCQTKDAGIVYVRRGKGYKGGSGDGYDRSEDIFFAQKIDGSKSVCEGASARLTASYESSFVGMYEWRKIGNNEVLSDSAVLYIPKAGLQDRGKYYCGVKDIKSGKIYHTDTVELRVRKLPVPLIGSPSSPVLICYGDTLTLNATASEAGKEEGDEYTYSWGGNGIVGEANSPIVKVAPELSTDYIVTVNNGGCMADGAVRVIAYRPVIDIPDYVYIAEGGTLELPVEVPEGARLIWTADGNVFEDINPFIYPDIRKTMEISVKMLNEGCEAIDNCKVYVKRGRGYQGGSQDGFDRSCVAPVIIEQNRSEVSCVATGAELWVSAEGSSLNYVWQKLNERTKKFETFVPSPGSKVKGLETYKLTFDPLVLDDNGVYLCQISNECGQVTTDTFFLSVGGVPVLKSGLNREWDQCVDGGDSTHLNVVAVDPQGKELTYTWFKVDTVTHRYTQLTDPNKYNEPYLKLLLSDKAKDEGMYLINIQNACGNTRDSVFIPVNTPVNIIEDSDTKRNIIACAGANAEFSVRVSGGGKVRYKLVKVKKVISVYPLVYEPDISHVWIGSSKVVLEKVTKADEGNYVWEVDNGCGRDTLGFIALKVETPPVVSGVSDTTELCVGMSGTLRCRAYGEFSDLKYEWYKDGRPTGIKIPEYTEGPLTPSFTGNYVCRVSNICPAVEGPSHRMVVKEKPVLLGRPYIKESYCEGDSLTLDVALGNIRIDSVRWYHNETIVRDIPGRFVNANTNRIRLPRILSADAGVYRLYAYNECGLSQSETAKLVVDIPARFNTDLSGYADLVLCDGKNQALSVATTGTAPIRYIWTHNAKILADGFSNTIYLQNVKADTAGMYCCEIQNRCGGKVVCADIKVSHPDTFRFELNSQVNKVCTGDPDGLTAVLMGSDTNTMYYLYKEPGTLVKKIHGKDVVPHRGFIEFRGLMGGNYYVVGEDTKYVQGCQYRMPGNVTITEYPLPVKYKLFITKHFCKDQYQATLAIDGSEKNLELEYVLQKLNGKVWIPYLDKIRGTGDTIKWKNIPEGTYKVVARNVTTGCLADMANIVEVREQKVPLTYALRVTDNDSLYCANTESDVVLQLVATEASTKYTLMNGEGIYRKESYAPVWDKVESGDYYVIAENQWGCRIKMGKQSVLTQQSPRQTSITGGFVYCREQTGTSLVEIKETEKGVRYRVYQESPKTAYLDTMGTGTSVFVKVPLEEKSYYIIAEDTTKERCQIALLDTAVFKMSRLQVEAVPDEHYIWSGATAQLPLRIVGQEGNITISWRPEEFLQPGENGLSMPTTLPLEERTDFTVSVQDNSACASTATVSVIIKGGKLTCDIRDIDRITSLDTVRACAGLGIDLYAWVDGGDGNYEYLWRDSEGEIGRMQKLEGYSRLSDGWLFLEVRSLEVTRKDSVWIDVYSSPEQFRLLPSGLLCVHKNKTPELKLSGSQPGVRYILSYSSDNSRYNEMDSINGTGGNIVFTVSDAYTHGGYYKVQGKYIHEQISCKVEMEGVAEIRQGAELFNISGDKSYCGENTDTVRIDNGQQDVTYSLYRRGTEGVLASHSGQAGMPFVFTGNFGTGNYFVTAQKGVCVDTLSGEVHIERNGLPKEIAIKEKGSYCSGDCPRQITLTSVESGVDYILMRYNHGQEPIEIERKSGSGTLLFGQHCEAGEYYIVARNAIGCERLLQDRIKIAGELLDVPLDGDRDYCDMNAGYEGTLKIATPQDGATYKLYTAENEYKGEFDSLAADGIHFRGLLKAGVYHVIAEAGVCSLQMKQLVTVRALSLPGDNVLQAPYTLCEGDGQLFIYNVSSLGYNYNLYWDSLGVKVKMASKPGTGGTLSWGGFDRIGDYYITATQPAQGCEWKLPEKYHIDKTLEEYNITGNTSYCISDEGVVIGIDGTEPAVDYVLQKWDDLFGEYRDVDRLTGKGMAVAFKGYFPAGTYQVKAIRGCEKIMKGELTVSSKAMPADSTEIVLVGVGCVDSMAIIRVDKAEQGVTYSLYHNGEPVGDALTGNDLMWVLDTAVLGTYKVVANKDNCLYTFPKAIEIGERPFISSLKGDVELCANLNGELYMENWDKQAAYTLCGLNGTIVSTGEEAEEKLYFRSVPVGTYYAIAARGNCEVRGEEYTIAAVQVPVLQDGLLNANSCVQRGNGIITITGMSDTLHYILKNSSGHELLNYKGEVQDTVFENLNFDRYCMIAEDARTSCRSDEFCVEIRESVSQDSLTGNFSYCEGDAGVILSLSGSEKNMVYRMLTETGDLIEEIADGKLQFAKKYKEGKYVFRKERSGFMGGCYITDTIQVRKFSYPVSHVDIEVIDGNKKLCAGEEYTIQLKNTDTRADYILVQNPGTQTQQFMDTVQGDGAVIQFSQKLNAPGFYKIYVTNREGGCGLYLDTTFRINALPRKILAEGCSYCISSTEKDNCAVTIRNLTAGIMYYITRVEPSDTLYGPGMGIYENCQAGIYHIIAEDTLTGCKDTVASTQVTSYEMPDVYTIATVCDVAGEIKTLDGSDIAVNYYLYKNGVRIAGPVVGNGGNITFGEYTEPGIYKVKALSEYGCERWMRDSATIYAPLNDYKLIQEGRYCKEGKSGVTIRYESGSEGWYYFLKKGMWSTDTLPGNSKELVWTSINGDRILSAGKYDLYAYNACATRLIKSITVIENPLPTVFRLNGGDAAICTGTGVDLILSGSQVKTTYQLMFVTGGNEQLVTAENGTGGEIYLGKYSSVGQYLVYAVADSSGCRVKMDDKMFYPGATPEVKKISGKDICLNGAGDKTVNICVMGALQYNVNYYLHLQSELGDKYVDTLLSGESELCFRTQQDTGCYYVMAQEITSGCNADMDGQYCIGLPPGKHNLLKDKDTVRLCQGETHCVSLDDSDSGVKYILLCDGVEQGKAVLGTGDGLNVGCVGAPGLYQVKAFTGDCSEIMNDSVRVQVEALPGMFLKKEYEYCELAEGVMLGVKAPTKEEFKYILRSPDGLVLETRNGDVNNQGFDFNVAGLQKKAGYYKIEAVSPAGCWRSDSIEVVINPLPQPFRVKGAGGEWICMNGTTEILLDSSQMGVEYRLYQKMTGNADKKVSQKYGTGKGLILGTVRESGEYYVMGTDYTTGCENNMYSHLILKQADTIRAFNVIGLRTGYCYTDNVKGSLALQESQAGVIYQLYQGGKRIGSPLKGTGGTLTWNGLEGMPCSNKTGVTDVGYIYEILGRDTLTGCEAWMTGKVGIVEESDPQVSAWHPNKDILRCEGESVQFNLSATGCNLYYRWKRDGYVVKDTADEFYNIASVTLDDYGTYYCEVHNSCGIYSTPSVRLSVRDSLVYLKRMEDKAVCGSDAASVILTGYIQNGHQYEWYKLGNESVTLSYDEWYRISPVNMASAGFYVFRAENECGVLADTMELSIDATPDLIAPEFRTDTICAGNRYILNIQSPDTVKWYRNGVYTGVRGNDYICPSLTVADEGLYTVRVANACGERILKIAQLYVDDTIKIVSIRPSELVCENSMVDLYIRTMPENRVSYIWEKGGVVVARNRNTYRAGPMTSAEPEYTYWITYSNKCDTKRAAIRLAVSNKLEYKDPEPQVLICTEEGKDTAIFISHPATLIASYQWYWQKFETGSDPVKLDGEIYDTLRIEAKTSNTGYYYCEIGNVCNPVTTQSTWFRVDSIPILLTNLADHDTLCVGGDKQLVLQASGGGLTYTWNIRKKDGTTEISKIEKGTFVSSAALLLNNLDMSYDSCQIWCNVSNNCGEVTSATMRLSVRLPMEVKIEHEAYESCGEAHVVVTMSQGRMPWSYSLLNEANGTTLTRNIADNMVDTLCVTTSGRYKISRLEDQAGCVRSQGLPSFIADIHDLPKAVISGGGATCLGDSVYVAIDVLGGVGPWQIAVYSASDSLPAQYLPITNPINLSSAERHIDFGFPAVADETYYINNIEDTYAGAAMCEGLVSGNAVVSIVDPRIVRYKPLTSDHVGLCRDINLLDLLQPYQIDADGNKTALKGDVGIFYVDEVALPDSIWWSADMKPGGHHISYELKGERCPLKPEVLLYVDTLPEITTFITDVEGNEIGQERCVDNEFGYNLKLTGAYPFTVEINKERITVRSEHSVTRNSILIQDTLYREKLSFLKEDSCVYYTIERVNDVHGCEISGLPVSDTLIKALPAELQLTVSENNSFRALKKTEYISMDGSLLVRVELPSAVGYWTLQMSYTPVTGGKPVVRLMNISAKDTLLSLKNAGDYEWKALGNGCLTEGTVYTLSLRQYQTGYIQVAAILEGAFRPEEGKMISEIKDQLPLYGLKKMPVNVKDSVIDWIVVELRKPGNKSQTAVDVAELSAGVKIVAKDTCLLLASGCVVDRTGNKQIGLSGSDVNDIDTYYVVLHHRNHLPVMSENAYKVVLNSAGTGMEIVDFRIGTNVYTGEGILSDHMTEVVPGKWWALSAGDVDLNALISLRDPNMVLWNLKIESYSRYDVNFDGRVDWKGTTGTDQNTDWTIIFKNRHKYTEVKTHR